MKTDIKVEDMRLIAVYGERDDAAYWLMMYFALVYDACSNSRDWYLNRPRADIPTVMLSSVLSPGVDGEKRLRHRLFWLVDRMKREHVEETAQMRRCLDVLEFLLDELKRIFTSSSIEEARRAFLSLYDYATNDRHNRHTETRFKSILGEMAEAFLSAWTKFYEFVQTEECALLGAPAPDAYTRQMIAIAEETHEQVLARPARGRPMSLGRPTKKWLVDNWLYLSTHAETSRTDLKGRSLTRRDAWETLSEQAKAKGISSYEAFVTALRTALDNSRKGLLGEAYREKVLAFSHRFNRCEGLQLGATPLRNRYIIF